MKDGMAGLIGKMGGKTGSNMHPLIMQSRNVLVLK